MGRSTRSVHCQRLAGARQSVEAARVPLRSFETESSAHKRCLCESLLLQTAALTWIVLLKVGKGTSVACIARDHADGTDSRPAGFVLLLKVSGSVGRIGRVAPPRAVRCATRSSRGVIAIEVILVPLERSSCSAAAAGVQRAVACSRRYVVVSAPAVGLHRGRGGLRAVSRARLLWLRPSKPVVLPSLQVEAWQPRDRRRGCSPSGS